MQQGTLDSFLVRSFSQPAAFEPESELERQPVQNTSTGCQVAEPATRNHLLRTLAFLGTGTCSARRIRAELQHCGRSLRQVLSYGVYASTASTTDPAVVGIAPCGSKHRAAIIHASGVLNIYSIPDLVAHTEHHLHHRQVVPAVAVDNGPGLDTFRADSNSDASTSYTLSTDMPPTADVLRGGQGHRARRSVGTRTSVILQQQATSEEQISALYTGAVEAGKMQAVTLPSGGWRSEVGRRLADVAWSPTQPGQLALAGDQLTIMDLGQGSMRRTWVLTPRTGRACSGGQDMNSLAFMKQGPYTVCAQLGNTIQLWDARRGRAAVAEVVAPGKGWLTSNVQVSNDGQLLYAVSNSHQLLVWDLRKSSNSSGVMHFGGTGLYHHPLLSQQDVSGPLRRAYEGQGLAAGQGASPSGWQLAVDTIAVDPTNHARMAFIMQDCTAAVAQMPSCTITNMWISESNGAYAASGQWSGYNRYGRHRKRGCWAKHGDYLYLPRPFSTAQDGEPPRDDVLPRITFPVLGSMDCRTGNFLDGPQGTNGIDTRADRLDESDCEEGLAFLGSEPAICKRRRQSFSVHRSFASPCQGTHQTLNQYMTPIADWGVCVADGSAIVGRPWVLTGTLNGEILVLTG